MGGNLKGMRFFAHGWLPAQPMVFFHASQSSGGISCVPSYLAMFP
jgi:hypothetical protein